MWEIGHQWDIDRHIDMEHGLSIWDMGYGISISVYRYGYLPYLYGHPGYRYGIWANDMGDDSIDTVIFHMDMRYLVTLDVCFALPRIANAMHLHVMSDFQSIAAFPDVAAHVESESKF